MILCFIRDISCESDRFRGMHMLKHLFTLSIGGEDDYRVIKPKFNTSVLVRSGRYNKIPRTGGL